MPDQKASTFTPVTALSGAEGIPGVLAGTNILIPPSAIAAFAQATEPLWMRTIPISVSMIGDSITAHCSGNGSLTDLSSSTVLQTYNSQVKTWGARSWITYGAMRSNYAWYPFEYFAGYSGGTSAVVQANCLPAVLGNPYGLPDACVVLAGTNDVGVLPLATTLANLKAMYNSLITAGVLPIACTIPPTAANVTLTQLLNMGIVRLAQGMKIPLADFYAPLVNAGTGAWVNANYTDDNTHPTPLGASVMGYQLNQALLPWLKSANRLMTGLFDLGAGVTVQLRDPNLTAVTGTVNTSSSKPSQWGNLGTPAMGTVFNSSGAEPGTGLTMLQVAPALGAQPALYHGNSWSIAGNGANAVNANILTGLPVAAGDKILVRFRVKWLPSTAPATAGGFRLICILGGVHTCGMEFMSQGPTVTGAVQANIGSESAYPAGDFYQVITAQAANVGTWTPNIALGLESGLTNSNAGDSVTIANVAFINLTQAAIYAP